jgi:hypothetical protein
MSIALNIMKIGINSVKLFDLRYNFPFFIIIVVLLFVSKVDEATDAIIDEVLLSFSMIILFF